MIARVFQKLHPFNWPLAFAASLTGGVAYWRAEFLPQVLLQRFEFLDPATHFSLEEWQDELEAAFAAWRWRMDESRAAFRLARRVLGTYVDFSANWQQWLAIQYEERHLFLALAARACGAAAPVARSGLEAPFRSADLPLEEAPAATGALAAWLDRAWNAAVCLLYAARSCVAAMRVPSTAWPESVDVLWNGISTSEYADTDDRLDFSFLAQRRLLDPARQLYFLPAPPSADAQARLARAGVQWRLLNELGGTGTGVRTAAAIAWQTLRELLRAGDPVRSSVAIRFTGIAAPWLALQRRLGARLYLSSISACWPEGAEVAAMRAAGATTVNWSYSGNAFRFARDRPGYRDAGLLRSIAVADELWVWNEAFRDWLEARRTGAARRVEVIGPVMAGDSGWLALAPAAARERFGIRSVPGSRYVALFDVATLNQAHRRLYGFGPTTAPLDMLSQLYVDARRLLESDPSLYLILKPKRSFDEVTREYPDSLQALLQCPARDRILLLDHRIDPYIPIALAEVCVGNPFTSPVIAAIESGRTGLFHDPLAQVLDFFPQDYRRLVTHSYAELEARLNEPAAARQAAADPGRAFADRINSLLHDGKTQTL
jgi:hypothetical protein